MDATNSIVELTQEFGKLFDCDNDWRIKKTWNYCEILSRLTLQLISVHTTTSSNSVLLFCLMGIFSQLLQDQLL